MKGTKEEEGTNGGPNALLFGNAGDDDDGERGHTGREEEEEVVRGIVG